MDGIGATGQNLSFTCQQKSATSKADKSNGATSPPQAEFFNLSSPPLMKKISGSFVSTLLPHALKVEPGKIARSAVEEAYASPLGLIGGVLGMSLGILYDISVLGPIITGAAKAPDGEVLKTMAKEFLAPLTLAAKGAKRFHKDAKEAISDELNELGQYGKFLLENISEDTEKTLLGKKKMGLKESIRGFLKESAAMSFGLIGGLCGGLWGLAYSCTGIAPLIVAGDKSCNDSKTTFGCFLKETMAPATWGVKKTYTFHNGGKEAMEEVLEETGDAATRFRQDITEDVKHIFGKNRYRGLMSRIKRVFAEACALPMGLIGALSGAAWGTVYSGSILFPFLIGDDKSCYGSKTHAGYVIKEFLATITYSALAGYGMYNGTRKMLGAD
ncbi:MAG: hypothetical protein AB2L14_04800 [Candidatus Xenobiia bacterium LiM19]